MPQAVGKIRLGLPQERCYIVVERSTATTLKVDKPRLPVLYHHVTRLKITIHECVARNVHQHIRQAVKIVLKTVFVKFQSRSFQEAVFEVVEIPHHRAFIETLSRETYSEIHTFGSGKLYIRQQTYRIFQQLPFVDRK